MLCDAAGDARLAMLCDVAGDARTCSAVSSTGWPSYSSLTLSGRRVYSGGNRTPACSSVVHLMSLLSGSAGCRDGADACTNAGSSLQQPDGGCRFGAGATSLKLIHECKPNN
jgi:hypothetical protein